MAYRSGLAAQLGLKAETTVGTPVTVDKFYEFLEASPELIPEWLESAGLRAGGAYKRAARVSQSVRTVEGDISLEVVDRGGMGTLFKHAVGAASGPTQIAATTAYRTIITPGSKTGLGLTIQLGRPETASDTVRPFTYQGCKITEWEFSCEEKEIATLTLTIDGWDQSTATTLAAASYTALAQHFSFEDATTFKLGGTASTTSGLMSVASGVTVASIVKGITIKGETPMATERFGLGNAGVKREQLENDIPMLTGELDTEFYNRTEFYDLFATNATTAMELVFSQGDAGDGNPFKLGFIMPAVKFKVAEIGVEGPDILPQKIEFEAYDDGSGTNAPYQIEIISTDTVL